MQAATIPPSLLRREISSVIIRSKLACKKVGNITRDCNVAEWFCDILPCESAPRFLLESNSSLSLSPILRPPHLRPAFAQLIMRGHFVQGVVEALDERMSELRTLHKFKRKSQRQMRRWSRKATSSRRPHLHPQQRRSRSWRSWSGYGLDTPRDVQQSLLPHILIPVDC